METNLGCVLNGHVAPSGPYQGNDEIGFWSVCENCSNSIYTPPSRIDPQWNWVEATVAPPAVAEAIVDLTLKANTNRDVRDRGRRP